MHLILFLTSLLFTGSLYAIDSLPAEFHGKIIGFIRQAPVIKKYTHKGIVFVPSEYNGEAIKADSAGNTIKQRLTYVLHLWYPGNSKYKARIRMDPLHDVVLGDDFEILADSPHALPTEVVIARAVSVMGEFHRGVSYNFVGNNCGHFVAWAKYGSSKFDTQFRDWLHRLAVKSKIPHGPVFAQKIYSMVDQEFQDQLPAVKTTVA